MARPRSDDRSGASPRSGPEDAVDLAALRRELYRPGAGRADVEAYLAARGEEPGAAVRSEAEAAPAPRRATPPAPVASDALDAAGAAGPRPAGRRLALIGALALVVPAVGIAVLPRQAPPPAPAPAPTISQAPVAPTTIDGLRGASTLLVALPFRTSRVRVRLECGGRRARYSWTALGRDAQTQQFIPGLGHSGLNCTPFATYVAALPGDVDALRFLVTVDGPYALSVEPL